MHATNQKKVKFVKVRRRGGKLPLVTFDQRDAEEGERPPMYSIIQRR